MDVLDWLHRCAARLGEQWPRADGIELADTARDLWLEPRWRGLGPESAAVEWLRQGIPEGDRHT